MSSILAYITPPLLLDYTATKEGIKGLFHSLRYSSLNPSLGIPNLRTNLIAPSLIKTAMSVDRLVALERERGFAVGEVSDTVNAALRVLCDKNVEGRAVAVGKDFAVDLCDDFEGQNGNRECRNLVESGLLGWGPFETGTFRMVD
jgi:5'-hydroxyaverantin dehydrogenase